MRPLVFACVLAIMSVAAADVSADAAECVPRLVLRAIDKAERVQLVRLGPLAERRLGRHDDAPGSFMGCTEVDRFDVGGRPAERLIEAFTQQSRYECHETAPSPKAGGHRTGVIGIEFDGPAGRVRVLKMLSEGSAEIGFASGVRHFVGVTGAAERDWKGFLEAFSRERRSTPDSFLSAMLEAQPGSFEFAHNPTGSVLSADSTALASHAEGLPGDCPLPKLGETNYVEKLPEAIKKVPPSYPDDAREAGVDGTVLVYVLVDCDGLVRETAVRHSIPLLNEAAVAAVRQWRFQAATSLGHAVGCWVEIPVKFSLH